MDPQPKSTLLPLLLAFLGSGILFGTVGYYIATSHQSEVNPDLYTFRHASSPQPKVVTSATPIPSPTPSVSADETATWVVYKNIKYQYQLKYPQTAKIVALGIEGAETNVTETSSEVIIKENNKSVLHIFEQGKYAKGTLTPQLIDKDYSSPPNISKPVDISKQPVTINGLSAYKVIVTQDNQGTKEFFYYIETTNGYILKLGLDKFGGIADTIISTFKPL